MARIVAIEMKRVQIKAEYNQLFEMKPVKKSGNAPWVRVASSAQSWWEDPTFPICAFPPRLRAGSDAYPGRANYSVDFNGLLFAQPSIKWNDDLGLLSNSSHCTSSAICPDCVGSSARLLDEPAQSGQIALLAPTIAETVNRFN